MKTKKIFALLLALTMVFTLLTGCGSKKEEDVTLIVFAAASMTETLTELGNKYMEEHENVDIVFNFQSSGTLKTQIQEAPSVTSSSLPVRNR
jgi:molybdate transport system substrate-binding protein